MNDEAHELTETRTKARAFVLLRVHSCLLCFILCAMFLSLAGCVSQAPRHGPSTSALSLTDPCPSRLHDLCGPLLMYYAVNHKLPPRLQDLSPLSDVDISPLFTCPVSNKPYLYNPQGILAPGGMGKLIIYDATAVHAGMRWAVTITESPSHNAPLIAKVIAVKDSLFPQ